MIYYGFMKSSTSKLLKYTDLRTREGQKLVRYFVVGLIVVLCVVVRISLIHFKDPDYTYFSSWYDYVNKHGLHSFKYAFSNYNPPYTYFLYILTILPISKLVAIKGLLGFFDIILALSVYCLVKVFRPVGQYAAMSGLAIMFAPTVLITGVFWGQFDQLYVAFILFSLYYALRDRSELAWAMFGVAIAVKFQAIFFLPALLIFSFKRIKLLDIYWALLAFVVLTIPPVFAGRSLSSLFSIYPDQAKLFNGQLTLSAPNIYQWVPNTTFRYLNHPGIALTLTVIAAIALYALNNKKYTRRQLLLVSTLMLYVVPFLLPAMHERYFFPASVASLVLAFIYPTFVWLAVSTQLITILSYGPFLFGSALIPLPILSVFMLVNILYLTRAYLKS
jgi:Gpi18-like mannosyltransferase